MGIALLSQMAHLRRSFSLFFHPASPIQPPPLRSTSFHRKEGVSTRAPSMGRGCRAQRGGVGFLFCGEAASSLPSPFGKGGPRQRRSGALVNDALVTIFFALFHPARTLSGSLRSPPSPRGEGFVRRYSFFPHMRVFALTMREKRHSRIVAFPLGEGFVLGTAALSQMAYLRRSPTLFHTASTLSGSLRLPPSPRGEGFVPWTAALSQMPCFHSAQTKTALRGRALQSGFWFYYSTVTDFARFLGLSTSFPLLIEV